ncbi:tripartite tricarboxylate transporter substrate binding protein [Cupriavidus sp. NPDC089707]|uniref:tripartite tricarboxylate transporter substrate binding protein n=1 Tax=Cupriavidus sp. NPDC089707 TaxID=3363963 RepID=UPI00382F619C
MKLAALLFAAGLAAATPALAQTDFPSRPVKIVVPFSAGGIVDSIARLIGDKLSAKYGQPVLVENRVGAGGAIGTDYVAKAPADGYTLLMVSPSHAVNPILQKNVSWDPVRDFKGIVGVGFVPNVIVVHPSVPAKTMAEFVALAKKSNPPMTYASAGVGTSNHLSGELLAQEAGIKLTHVPYKGQTDAINDLLSGRVAMMPMTAALAIPYVKAGKLRALGVTTIKRASALPELPTVAEAANLPNYQVATWFGLVAPAGTPDALRRKVAADVTAILAMTDVRARFATLGMELAPQSSTEFDTFVAREAARWGKVIKQAGFEPN